MQNKIGLVTGGSRGLGASMARHLAAAGVDVVITYVNNQEAATNVVQEIKTAGGRAAALQLNVEQTETFAPFGSALAALVAKEFGRERIDLLINNAGFGVYAPFVSTTEAQLDALIAVHLKAPFLLTQSLLPLINDGGRILNLSTGLVRFTMPGFAAYAAAKAAVEVLTRYMAVELGSRRIRVNVLAPGAIATDFGGGTVRDNEAINNMVAAKTALGRVGQADDIGSIVAQIMSDGFGWVNGTRIEASGGQEL